MKVSLTVYSPEGEDPFSNYASRPRFEKVNRFLRLMKAVAGGGVLTRASSRPNIVAGTQYAMASIILGSVQAADTVTLNGAVLTAVSGAPTAEQFDMSGTDTQDATSLANAINNTSASAFIQGVLKASNLSGVFALNTALAGDTVTIAGVTLRAVAQASAKPDEFSIAGNDAADATALAACINAHPVLRELVNATAASNSVLVRQLPFGPTAVLPITSSNNSRIATTAMAAGATVNIYARDKGRFGNFVTIATSNGTRLAIVGSATRLAGGTEATQINF